MSIFEKEKAGTLWIILTAFSLANVLFYGTADSAPESLRILAVVEWRRDLTYMKTVCLIGSFTSFIHRPRRESQLEREITLPTLSEVPDVGGKTYNHLYYKIEGGAMRKLLALPKLLAVLTVAAATLLLVGAASAGVVNGQCGYDNNGHLWCWGQGDGAGVPQGLWIAVETFQIANIPGLDLPQYQDKIYVWNGSQWVHIKTNEYSLIGGASQPTSLSNYQAWILCKYSNLSPPLWEGSGSNCGPPPQ
jgi:hypothetical protein